MSARSQLRTPEGLGVQRTGEEPLPTTMEQIRRSVDVVPLLEPPV
jgi:hypothetical protein